MKKAIWAVGIFAVLISCTGKQGPMGPQGVQGEQGEPGPGTRTVYLSTNPIPSDYDYYVSVPEIHLDDMPMVSVYVCPPGYEMWLELPMFFEGASGVGMAYALSEGTVMFEGCGGLNYKIVIVE